MFMRLHTAAVVPVVAATLALSACGENERSYDVTGQVTDKQQERECKTKIKNGKPSMSCATEYEIFVRGEQDDVDVTRTHYDRCEVGDQFPKCTGNGQ